MGLSIVVNDVGWDSDASFKQSTLNSFTADYDLHPDFEEL